jgi:hypothetical protein
MDSMVGIGTGRLSLGKPLGTMPLWQPVPQAASRASFSERGLTTALPSGIFSISGILPMGWVPS